VAWVGEAVFKKLRKEDFFLKKEAKTFAAAFWLSDSAWF